MMSKYSDMRLQCFLQKDHNLDLKERQNTIANLKLLVKNRESNTVSREASYNF